MKISRILLPLLSSFLLTTTFNQSAHPKRHTIARLLQALPRPQQRQQLLLLRLRAPPLQQQHPPLLQFPHQINLALVTPTLPEQ